MRHTHSINSLMLCAITLLALWAAQSVLAQTTQFTYQGKLSDTGAPASGQYDFQFKLFDTATVGTGIQQGSTVAVSNVTVTVGIFTVQIDFGAGVFPAAANRFLEIAVKQTSGSSFTTLSPRQPVTANPYAIRSLNSTTADGLSVSCVNCITSSQIQSVQGSQVTGNVAGSQINGLIPVASVPAGSANYIQNSTSQQATSNFNLSGSGTAAGTLSSNVVNAATQYNIGGSRVLTSNAGSFTLIAGANAGTLNTGTNNSFVGPFAGTNNTTGTLNSFFGSFAGNSNTTGQQNSFFGQGAGATNTTTSDNSFFGFNAGFSTTSGSNSFFGSGAGAANTTGNLNSFFGKASGKDNTTGGLNSFFGQNTGQSNTTGDQNSFFGQGAGQSNTTSSNNSFFGFQAGLGNTAKAD
jgi:hypothetical protein